MLIGLYSSVMQSGKSQVAKHLVGRHGFELVKFAGPLKAMVAALLEYNDLPRHDIEDALEGDLRESSLPPLGYSARQLTQTLGTEWGRVALDAGFWTRQAAILVADKMAAGQRVVMDDMRFPNEMQMVLSLGGTPLRVHRPGVKPYRDHPSEGLLDDYAMRSILNDTTLESLFMRTDRLVKELACG